MQNTENKLSYEIKISLGGKVLALQTSDRSPDILEDPEMYRMVHYTLENDLTKLTLKAIEEVVKNNQ